MDPLSQPNGHQLELTSKSRMKSQRVDRWLGAGLFEQVMYPLATCLMMCSSKSEMSFFYNLLEMIRRLNVINKKYHIF